MSETMTEKLPGCIGYLDGTHVPLYEAPIDNHEAYFSRKQVYGMHMQAVCDKNLLFRSVSVGYPASAHDSRVFLNSPLGRHTEKFLSDRQWIAGDSAYKLTRFVVTPFRDNATVGIPSVRRKFNRHFSSHRVKIENAFGVLKNIFGSLRSLRIRVDKKQGHRKACNWIMACVVLYNMIRPQESSIEQITDDMIQEIDSAVNDVDENNLNTDSSKRDELYEWFQNTYT